MNVEATLKAMIEAGSAAAKGKWKKLKGFVEAEFKSLATAGRALEKDLLADLAAAAALPTAKKRGTATGKAKLRASLAFENLRLAAEGVMLVAEADLKLAAQDALNAAIGVLRKAINDAAGIAIL
jgi:hypothetical protein